MGSCVSSLQPNSGSAKVDQMSSSIEKSSLPPTPVKDNKPTNFVETPLVSFGYKSRVSPFNTLSSNRNSVSSSRSFGGSKDEAFYDTQVWLDSDCDDDFYSVNGDFTPRGSTPVHHAVGTPQLSRVFSPQVSRVVFEGKPPMHSASNRSRGGTPRRRSFSSTIQPDGAVSEDVYSPNPVSSSTTTTTRKSKTLADLFRESMRDRDRIGLTTPPLPPKLASRGPSGLRHSVSSFDNENLVDDYVPVKDEEKPAKVRHGCFPRFARGRTFNTSKKTYDPSTSSDDLKA